MKRDKGQAGLSLLLSLIATIFVIGLLILVFVLTGSNLASKNYDSASGTVNLEALSGVPTTAGLAMAKANLRSVSCTVTGAYNGTGGILITSGNYSSVLGCKIANLTDTAKIGVVAWKVNYTYTYLANNTATDIIASTNDSMASVPSWFPIIITITIMVVLILLTVIIITAIRSTGLLQGNQ